MPGHAKRGVAVLIATLLFSPQAPAQSPAQTQQPAPPTFRGRVTLVPVEVRVVDKKGHPVTDLTQDDFTITENGRPQAIRHFLPIALTADGPASPATRVVDRSPARIPADEGSPAIAPQTRRVFLIVLGHGNLQVPSKGLDGAIHLVRDLLLPQDVVSVVAWNRATDFTTNHEQIAKMLERYTSGHPLIDDEISQAWSGLAAVYGTGDIPKAVQKQIDATLGGADAPTLRTVTTDPIPLPELFANADQTPPDVTLDEYLKNAGQASDDLARVYSGINYLRYIEGEKHLWFISPAGLPRLKSLEDDRRLAANANDARVVIDMFNTGGVENGVSFMQSGRMSIGGPQTAILPNSETTGSMEGSSSGIGGGRFESPNANRLPTINIQGQFNRDLDTLFTIQSAKNVTQMTGGQFTGNSYGSEFADRIDATTRSGYQLGYYSTNPQFDGKYRRVSVSVKRRGVTLLYRHGYYARDAAPTLDRRQVVSANRVLAAARYTDAIGDLGIDATATLTKTPKGDRQMAVKIFLDSTGVIPFDLMGRRDASLDVAVFCGDKNQQIVGRTWDQVDVRLDEAQYARFRESGVMFSVNVPVKSPPKFVKVVVYDYTTDKVGTVLVTLK